MRVCGPNCGFNWKYQRGLATFTRGYPGQVRVIGQSSTGNSQRGADINPMALQTVTELAVHGHRRSEREVISPMPSGPINALKIRRACNAIHAYSVLQPHRRVL